MPLSRRPPSTRGARIDGSAPARTSPCRCTSSTTARRPSCTPIRRCLKPRTASSGSPSAMRILAELTGRGRPPCGSPVEPGMRRRRAEPSWTRPSSTRRFRSSVRPLFVDDSRFGPAGHGRVRSAMARTGSRPSPSIRRRAEPRPRGRRGPRQARRAGPRRSDETIVRFACGADHDALVGLAPPARGQRPAVLREEEAAAARGVLVAPSAQERQPMTPSPHATMTSRERVLAALRREPVDRTPVSTRPRSRPSS